MKDPIVRIGGLLLLLTAAVTLGLLGCSVDDPLEPPTATTVDTSFERLDPVPSDLEGQVPTFDSLVLVLDGIQARRVSGDELDGWYGLEFEPTEYTLDALAAGLCDLVNDAGLPAGTYTQVRLNLCDGNRIVVDGVEHDLTVPGGQTSGVKLTFAFEIVDGQDWSADVTIDASGSVRVTGRGVYRMQPSLPIEAIPNGGGGDDGGGAIVGVALPVETHCRVWIDVNGEIFETYAALDTGEFLLANIPAGLHMLMFTPIEDGPWMECALFGIEVVEGETTDIGTFVLGTP